MRRVHLIALLGAGAAACAVGQEEVKPPEPPKLEGEVPAVGRQLDLEAEGRGTPVRLQGVTGRVTAVCVLGAGEGGGSVAEPSTEPAQAPPARETGGPGADPVAPRPGASEAEPNGAEERPEEGSAEARMPPAMEEGPPARTAPAAPGDRIDLPAEEAPPPSSPGQEGEPAAMPPPPQEEPGGAGEAPALNAEASRVLQACLQLGQSLGDRITTVGLTTDRALDLDRMPLRTYRDPGGEALRSSLDLDAGSRVILVDTRGRVAELFGPDRLDRLEPAASRLVR